MYNLIKKSFLFLVLCVNASVFSSDIEYTNRLSRIINTIANTYDPRFYDADNLLAATLAATNFIKVENGIKKNSPLGFKNSAIDHAAQTIFNLVRELSKHMQELPLAHEAITLQVKQKLQQAFDLIRLRLLALEAEVSEISKKQLLPLSKVQKNLIELLDLLVRENLKVTQFLTGGYLNKVKIQK